MAKYLLEVSYTTEGARGVLKEGGSARRAAVEQLAKKMGANVEVFYYAFGKNDVYVIIDSPGGNVDMAAVSMAVGSSGAASIKTTVLLTPEEIDQAAKKSVEYRPPGA
jgi:uncharacterized protein with GYD domain